MREAGGKGDGQWPERLYAAWGVVTRIERDPRWLRRNPRESL